MISAFGVEHGVISKAEKAKEKAKTTAAAVGGAAAIGGGVAISNSKAGQRVKAKIGEHYDKKALKVAEQILPTGTKIQGKNPKNVAVISGHKIGVRNNSGYQTESSWRKALGYRTVTTTVKHKNKEVGFSEVRRHPITGSIIPQNMQIKERHRGKGWGTKIMETAVRNAPTSDAGKVYFKAGSYGEAKGPVGHDVWRRKGIRYARGIGYKKGIDETKVGSQKWFDALKFTGTRLNDQQRKDVKRHIRRAKLGLEKPEDLRKQPRHVQRAMSAGGANWVGTAKGGKPFLGRSKYVAAGAAGAAAIGYAHNKGTRK